MDSWPVSWREIDTVLLDMDGTLIDLNYDNTLWNEHLPVRFARSRNIDIEDAEASLNTLMREMEAKLDYYCLDFWIRVTGLDVDALHQELRHLITYRPGAETFLDWLRQSPRRAVIATNAHRRSLEIKDRQTGVVARVDACHSAHDFGAPKEDPAFWEALIDVEDFDPRRTLFVDDNMAVLQAAADFGIAHLATITRPDSSQPTRSDLAFPAFDDFDEIIP